MKFATLALAAMAGSATLVSSQPAEAGNPFVAGLAGGVVGSLIGAALLPPPYPVSPYPVYVGPVAYPPYQPPAYAPPPPVVTSPIPVVVGVEPYGRPHDNYNRPKVVTYDDTVQVAGAEPWSPAWYDYCRSTFRSFDPNKGTYLGFDGKHHFCVVK
jgi:hypothetical protein